MKSYKLKFAYILMFISILCLFYGCTYKPDTSKNNEIVDSTEKVASNPLPSKFSKVFIIVFENEDSSKVENLPYFQHLRINGAFLSNYSALTNPSQPNYIALVSGAFYGVNDDNNHDIDSDSIVDLLDVKNISWKTYNEDYPGNCFLGARSKDYVRKHEPLLSFKNIQDNNSRCSKIVNSSQFLIDLESKNLPDFIIYIPNLKNDGHDNGVKFADNYLNLTFSKIFDDKGFIKDRLIIITFDEDAKKTKDKLIYTVLIGENVKKGFISNVHYTHYNLLRTIEDNLGIGNLGMNDSVSSPIQNIWA